MCRPQHLLPVCLELSVKLPNSGLIPAAGTQSVSWPPSKVSPPALTSSHKGSFHPVAISVVMTPNQARASCLNPSPVWGVRHSLTFCHWPGSQQLMLRRREGCRICVRNQLLEGSGQGEEVSSGDWPSGDHWRRIASRRAELARSPWWAALGGFDLVTWLFVGPTGANKGLSTWHTAHRWAVRPSA